MRVILATKRLSGLRLPLLLPLPHPLLRLLLILFVIVIVISFLLLNSLFHCYPVVLDPAEVGKHLGAPWPWQGGADRLRFKV